MSTTPTTAKTGAAKKAATAKVKDASPAPESKPLTESQLLSQARSAAMTRLRTAHLDEFNALMKQEATQRKVSWAPKKSAAEKARDQIAALLAEHPELAEEIKGTAPAEQQQVSEG